LGCRCRPEDRRAADLGVGHAAIVAESLLELDVRRHRFFLPAGLVVNLAGHERRFSRGA
jgi:hypothetical protein